LLESKLLARYDLIHLRSNISDSNRDKGHIGVRSLLRLAVLCWREAARIVMERPPITYVLISQNRTGFLRDTCLIAVAALLRRRLVGHFRGGAFDVFYRGSGPILRWVVRRVLAGLSRLVIQAERLRPMFLPFVQSARVDVVYNGIDVASFGKLAAGRSSHIQGEPIQILFIGHLSRAKGYVDLLHALDAVASDTKVRLLAVGERLDEERNIVVDGSGTSLRLSEVEDSIAALEERLRAIDRLDLLGTVYGEEKRRIFARADVFVLPSYAEGFPLSLLEAMAAGLPVICTPVGAIPEVVADGVHGLLVNPGQPAELAAAIQALATDPGRRQRMGAENARIACARYSLDAMADSMGDVFQAVLK